MTPRYNPWDQRLCLVPNGDLFKAVRAGKASIATDEIERFTETGVRLRSGQHLDADLVIAATGLKLQMLGGSVISVDGRPIPSAIRCHTRASTILPRQGLHKPWKYHQNYLRDLASLRFGALSDGVMQFERRPTTTVRLNREAQEHA